MPAVIFIVVVCLLVWMHNEFKESWRNGFAWLLWFAGTLCIIGGFLTGFGFLILWPMAAVFMGGGVKLMDADFKRRIQPRHEQQQIQVYEQWIEKARLDLEQTQDVLLRSYLIRRIEDLNRQIDCARSK